VKGVKIVKFVYNLTVKFTTFKTVNQTSSDDFEQASGRHISSMSDSEPSTPGTPCTPNWELDDLVAKLSPLAINQVPSIERRSKCWWTRAARSGQRLAESGDEDDDYVSFKEGPDPSSVSPPPRACTRPPLSPVSLLLRIPSICS
jgi:hypothetical protein